MAYNKSNIIVGAAHIYLSAEEYDATAPAELPDMASVTGSMASALESDAAWRGVGYTNGGVELSYSPDYGEVPVDQLLDVAMMFKQGQSVTVSTTLAESTLDNMLIAWGQGDDTLTGSTLVISGGLLGEAPIERSIAFVGPAPRVSGTQKERVYRLSRVMNVESVTTSLSRSEASMVPVSFRAFPDVNEVGAAAEYGEILERVIT